MMFDVCNINESGASWEKVVCVELSCGGNEGDSAPWR